MRRALLLVAFGVPAIASADARHPNPFLSQAKAFATQGEGDKCLKRLIQAEQKWKWNDKRDRAEIEMFGGICGYLIGETQAAEVSFKNAVKIDPKVDLPKDMGPGIEGLWTKATGRAVASPSTGPGIERRAEKKAEKTAAAETPPVRKEEAPPPSRVEPAPERRKEPTADEKLEQQLSAEAEVARPAKQRSLVLPVIIGVAGMGAGVGGIVFGVQAKSAEARFKSIDTFYIDAQAAASTARTDALIANVMFAAAGALVVAAVITFILSG